MDESFRESLFKASRLAWNSKYEEADKILKPHAKTNPLFALESAHSFQFKNVIAGTSDTKEQTLENYTQVYNLAYSCKEGLPISEVDHHEEDEEEDKDFVKHIEEDASEEDKEKIRTRSGSIFKSKKKIEKKGEVEKVDPMWKLECEVIAAEALFMKALSQLQIGAYLKGAFNLRKSWKLYQSLGKILEKDKNIPPHLSDAINFGIGLFYTFLSIVPSGILMALTAIGFVANRELGEKYLQEVNKNGGLRSPFAGLVLLLFFLVIPTGLEEPGEHLRKGKLVLDGFEENFPDNIMFNMFKSLYFKKVGQGEKAVESIAKSIELCTRLQLSPNILYFMEADGHFLCFNFETCRNKMEELTNRNITGFEFYGMVHLFLASSYLMLGELDKAKDLVHKVPSVAHKKSRPDAQALIVAKQIIATPDLIYFLPFHLLYLIRHLAHMSVDSIHRVDELLEKNIVGKTLSLEAVSMYNLQKGVILLKQGKPEEAKAKWEQILSNEKKLGSENFPLWAAHYELGELEFHSGNIKQCEKYIKAGNKLKGDGNETVRSRYRLALETLAKKK